MNNFNLTQDEQYQVQEAKMEMKVAQDLRAYVATKSQESEQELISALSYSPSLWQKVFPGEAVQVQKDIIRQRLKQMVSQQLEASERHFELYCSSLEIYAKIYKRELVGRGLAHLTRVFEEEKTNFFKLIEQNKPAEMRRFMRLKQSAREIYGDEPALLEMEEKSITNQICMTMEANERALNNLLNILIPDNVF